MNSKDAGQVSGEAQTTAAWYERRAVRLVIGVIVILCFLLILALLNAAWQWLEAVMNLVRSVSLSAAALPLLALMRDPNLSRDFRRQFGPAAPAPRDLQRLIAVDAQVDSAFMADICKVGAERWLEVREQEQADHAADVRREALFGSES